MKSPQHTRRIRPINLSMLPPDLRSLGEIVESARGGDAHEKGADLAARPS